MENKRIDLYQKYGNYNIDGHFIMDYELWDYYAQKPKLYKKRKILAWLFMLIPICGFIGTALIYEEMGLSIY